MDNSASDIEPQISSETSQPTDDPRPTKPVGKTAAKRRSGKRRAPKAAGGKGTREKGGIAFVYHDLDTAVGIAQAMLNAGGGAITRDQLAGVMSLSATGGTFLMRIAAARLFGLVTYNQSRFALTPLAFEILGNDEQVRRAARATAFLSVPLFSAIYSEFKGRPLPPRPHGLEAAFVRLGVPDKQRKTARVAFDKSAKQAGFFDNGSDRLVEPIIGPISKAREILNKVNADSEHADATDIPRHRQTDPLKEPLIHGLLARLPEAGNVWEYEKRVQWLRLFTSVLDMVYTASSSDPDGIEFIQVERKAL